MMTEDEKEKFVSGIVRYGVPAIVVVDVVFLAVLIYGLLNRFSDTVIAILVAFSFVGYHATYRALVGVVIGKFRPIFNLNSPLFIIDPMEMPLYDKLRVKDWKEKAPAWNMTHFMLSMKDVRDINKVGRVVRYNISAEITHHCNFYLSLFGTLFCLFKGMQQFWYVFAIVSLLIGIFGDVPFIMIQRYNRFRLLPLYLRLEEKSLKKKLL